MPKFKKTFETSYLNSILYYEVETGVLRWKVRTDSPDWWNIRYAGKIAGSADGKGYLKVRLSGKNHYAHRIIWKMVTGYDPSDQIDHIDGDGSNNRISNLRVVSALENSKNSKMRKHNTSGTSGVCWYKKARKWTASIKKNKKRIHLGLFADKEDAIKVRKAAEIALGYHPNHGRLS